MGLHVGDLGVGDEDRGRRPLQPEELTLADLEHELAVGPDRRLRRGRAPAAPGVTSAASAEQATPQRPAPQPASRGPTLMSLLRGGR